MNINIVDCTLRDGGYYNNWDFDLITAKKYLQSIEKAKIKYVELGFRFISLNRFQGPFAYTSEHIIKLLKIKKLKILIMINANDFGTDKTKIKKFVDKHFLNSNKSQIYMVRIAVNFDSYKNTRYLIELIKSKGYKIGLNLMQSDNKSNYLYQSVAKNIEKWKSVDVLYFADSLGVMNKADINRIIYNLKKEWSGDLGIHAHNNKGLALSNTITAINNGTKWADATILGMGRGAGNTYTEKLLKRIRVNNKINFDTSMLDRTVSIFKILKKKYLWGPNFFYREAANNRIHPTYIQELTKNNRYSEKDIIKVISFLKNKKSSSFDSNYLNKYLLSDSSKFKKNWSADNFISKNQVLIIGGGESVKKYKNFIESYIKKNKPYVLFCNVNKYINNNIGHITIACNPMRVLIESSLYKKINHKIIIPDSLSDNLLTSNITTLNYGMVLKKNHLSSTKFYCTLHSPLAFGYAASIILRSRVKDIKLVGFDGNKTSFKENIEMIETINIFKKKFKNVHLTSLTPSNFLINTSAQLFC